MRVYEGPAIVPALEAAGFAARDGRRRGPEPPAFRPRRRAAAGRRLAGVPARDDRRPEGRVGGRARTTTRGSSPRTSSRSCRLVRDWGAKGWADGERELLPGVTVVPTGGHSTGHQAIVVRGSGDGAQTLAFFGDLFMRPWAREPALDHRVRRLPARFGAAQGRAVRARPPTRAGSSCCRTRRKQPIGRWSAIGTASGSSRSRERRPTRARPAPRRTRFLACTHPVSTTSARAARQRRFASRIGR